jgi:hypothetical protein
MWAERWERGERGKSQRVGQLLPVRGPEWMGGFATMSKKLVLQVSRGSSLFSIRGLIRVACTLYRYRSAVHCVNTNEILVCRLKINPA